MPVEAVCFDENQPCELFVKAKIEALETRVFTINQDDDSNSILLKRGSLKIENEHHEIRFRRTAHSVMLEVTEELDSHQFEFGFGMYVSGQYFPDEEK